MILKVFDTKLRPSWAFTLQRRAILCLCREPKRDSRFVEPVTQTLYRINKMEH